MASLRIGVLDPGVICVWLSMRRSKRIVLKPASNLTHLREKWFGLNWMFVQKSILVSEVRMVLPKIRHFQKMLAKIFIEWATRRNETSIDYSQWDGRFSLEHLQQTIQFKLPLVWAHFSDRKIFSMNEEISEVLSILINGCCCSCCTDDLCARARWFSLQPVWCLTSHAWQVIVAYSWHHTDLKAFIRMKSVRRFHECKTFPRPKLLTQTFEIF